MAETSSLKNRYAEQKDALQILNVFENKSKCASGIFIETLLYQLQNQKEKKLSIQEKDQIIHTLNGIMSKYIAQTFTAVRDPDPMNWMTFFELAREMIRTEYVEVKSLNYKDGVFHIKVEYQITLAIEDCTTQGRKLCKYLLNQGYKDYGRTAIPEKYGGTPIKTGKRIGLISELEYPFTFEEQLFFAFKYLLYSNIFEIWKHVCDFMLTCKQKETKNIWYLRDRKLYFLFNGVTSQLFERYGCAKEREYKFKFKSQKDGDKLTFDMLNLLYNVVLFSQLKRIERKATIYTNIRFSKQREIQNQE
ncbi:MAG: hypothetical protein GF364_05845 [Candidatus Lokiarchaeota archaeon]|nr:hypothetical protein [Candidatus Lokiarchaeota archaeon]